jgi:hypothetical protein
VVFAKRIILKKYCKILGYCNFLPYICFTKPGKMNQVKTKKNVKSRKDALALRLGLDLADVEYYRYHPGATSVPVYAFDYCYYCVTRKTEKPATHRDGMEWAWVEVKDDYINRDGWHIWKSTNEPN